MNVRVEFLRSVQHYPMFLKQVKVCLAGLGQCCMLWNPSLKIRLTKKDVDTHPYARAATKEAVRQGRPLWHFFTYQ